ncbi:nitronate monooxygenase [Nonomuraea sp. NPDC052129]|uniref:nitronate monooxygenase n=1 Tax=Nonomuraea sp. NPDC052129 TaxID=3154651 RepID=UPI003432157A
MRRTVAAYKPVKGDHCSYSAVAAFTKLFGVQHPLALAPMGGSAGGALTAAVSRGGGLGLLGSGNGDPDWLAREVPIVARGLRRKAMGHRFPDLADRCWGGRACPGVRPPGGDAVLRRPEPVRRAGTALIIQVTDLEEARRAVDLGADVIVAQGVESGGHGARHGRSTLPFVPVVVDLAAPVPVLAAASRRTRMA